MANIVVGARNQEQLEHNLGAVGWNLTKEQVPTLDKASNVPATYSYWHQRGQPELGLGDPTQPPTSILDAVLGQDRIHNHSVVPMPLPVLGVLVAGDQRGYVFALLDGAIGK
jgi:hypothetical protein